MTKLLGLLEHTRRVHLTLVVTCLALSVGSSLSVPTSAERAYGDLRLVQAARDKYMRNAEMRRAARELNVDFILRDNYIQPVGDSTFLHNLFVELQSRLLGGESSGSISWGIAASTRGNYSPAPYSSDFGRFTPATLLEFKEAWEHVALGMPLHLTEIQWDSARVFRGGAEVELAPLSTTPLERLTARVALREEPDPTRRLVLPKWFVVIEFSTTPSVPADEIHVPIVIFRRAGVDFQAALFHGTEYSNLHGDFASAFRDLSNRARGLEDLTLPRLAEYLQIQYSAEVERVVLFGVGVPATLIGQWGLFILLCILLLLFLSIERLVGSGRINEEVSLFAWVCLYPGTGARIASLLTILVGPPVTALLLAASSWSHLTPSLSARVALVILAAMVTAASAATYHAHTQLVHAMAQTDHGWKKGNGDSMAARDPTDSGGAMSESSASA